MLKWTLSGVLERLHCFYFHPEPFSKIAKDSVKCVSQNGGPEKKNVSQTGYQKSKEIQNWGPDKNFIIKSGTKKCFCISNLDQ